MQPVGVGKEKDAGGKADLARSICNKRMNVHRLILQMHLGYIFSSWLCNGKADFQAGKQELSKGPEALVKPFDIGREQLMVSDSKSSASDSLGSKRAGCFFIEFLHREEEIIAHPCIGRSRVPSLSGRKACPALTETRA